MDSLDQIIGAPLSMARASEVPVSGGGEGAV